MSLFTNWFYKKYVLNVLAIEVTILTVVACLFLLLTFCLKIQQRLWSIFGSQENIRCYDNVRKKHPEKKLNVQDKSQIGLWNLSATFLKIKCFFLQVQRIC